VAKTVIVSDETIRQLLEAHASLAAWYYQMAAVLRDAGLGVEPPSEDQRRAFVKQAAQHFPEVATVAQTLENPRAYVPPPVISAPASVTENEGVSTPAPPKDHVAAPSMIAQAEPDPPPAPAAPPAPESPAASDVPPPPPIVDPTKVKYD
jgi:hypothetical protein